MPSGLISVMPQAWMTLTPYLSPNVSIIAGGQGTAAEKMDALTKAGVHVVKSAAELPAAVVDRATTLRSAKGLVALVWRAGFSMRVAGPLQSLLARLSPENVLRPSSSGGYPMAVEEMRWQIDFLSRMAQ